MKAIHKINIGLGLLVLVLLTLNLQQDKSEYQPLTDYKTDSITMISVKNDQRTIRFNKKNDIWLIDSFPGKPVKQAAIHKLLGILQTHSYRQFENTDSNRTSYGIEPSDKQIVLDNTVIRFGSIEPTEQLRYVLVNNKVHLITDLYLQFLLADEKFFTASDN